MTDSVPTIPDGGVPDSQAVPSESRGWAVAAHLLPLVSLAIIGPLFVWLIKRDEDSYVEFHAREALNFQISILIYSIVSGFLIFVFIGFILLPIVLIFGFVMSIVAAVRAANGEPNEYPFTMRFVSDR